MSSSERVARLLAVAAELGFRQEGYDGRGHLRLIHANGTPYSLAATPGSWNGDKNAIAAMQRIAGQRVDKQQHRRSRKNFATAGSTPAVAERLANAQFGSVAEEIERQADVLRAEWMAIVAAPSRRNSGRARQVCAEWDWLSDRLLTMHRPPLEPLPVAVHA